MTNGYSESFEGGIVFLAGVAHESGGNTIRNTHFKGCRIVGPAVVLAAGDDVKFAGSCKIIIPQEYEHLIREHPEAFFWLQPDDQPWAMGVIQTPGCRFEDCSFEFIAWAGYAYQRDWWTNSISIGRWAEEMGW